MKTRIPILLLCILVLSSSALAQTGPTGVWQCYFDTGTGQKRNLQFVINKLAGGAYGITVQYMEHGAVKKLTATSVSFADGKLVFTVQDLGGSYSGTLDKKKITGNWQQSGKAVPMVLTPFKRARPAGQDMDRLLGEWAGISPNKDGFGQRIICRFEKNVNGELAGFVDIPDGGLMNLPIPNIWMDGNQLRFRIPGIQTEIIGEFSSRSIAGTIKTWGEEAGDIELVKGKKYQPSVIRLDLTAEDMKLLQGRWSAEGQVTAFFRFEQNPDGEIAGFYDVPQSGVQGMRIYKASLVDGTLSLKATLVEYTGTLSGNTISGTMTTLGASNPFQVTITKE